MNEIQGIKRFDQGLTPHVMGGCLTAFVFSAAFSQNRDGSGYTIFQNMTYVSEPKSGKLKFFKNIEEIKEYANVINIPYYQN